MKKHVSCFMFCVVIICGEMFGCDSGILEARAEMFLRKVTRGKTIDVAGLENDLNFVKDAREYNDPEISKRCSELEGEIREMQQKTDHGIVSQDALRSFLESTDSISKGIYSKEKKLAIYFLLERFLTKLSVFLLEREETGRILDKW